MVSVLRSLDIIAAYVIQVVWFGKIVCLCKMKYVHCSIKYSKLTGEIPMWTNILGALLVILSVVIMTLEELVLQKLRSKFGSIGWC